MFQRFRFRRPSPAMVVALMALFVALGGSSYAALRVGSKQIVNNSIRSKDIRNGNVTSRDLKNNDVRGSDVRNGSLLSEDFQPGQLPAGPQGAPGATGARGAQGPSGISGLQRVEGTSASNSNSQKSAVATCPAGKRAIGSGADISGGKTGGPPNILSDVVIDEVIPSTETTVPGRVTVVAVEEEPTAAEWYVSAIALCATVP